jgi:hypothetical protein
MNITPKDKPPDFDEEFKQAVDEWREKHKLREDDATFLLIELFRIHQKHWDDIRHREMPSFNQFRSDIAELTQATKSFQQIASVLIDLLKGQPPIQKRGMVTRSAAVTAALVCLIAGYFIRKLWS